MTRTIDISLSADTVSGLKTAEYALYVLKAVKYGVEQVPFRTAAPGLMKEAAPTALPPLPPSPGGGAPLVWQARTNYLQKTTVAWDAAVQAYVSDCPIADQGKIVVGASCPVGLGQTVNVSATGGLSTTGGGGEGAVSIVSQGAAVWTCGLSEGAAGVFAPTCAFPLYAYAMDVLTPQDRVFLMFAEQGLAPGSVIVTAYSQGLLVDAAAADRAVSFDLARGWSAGGATWATPIPPQANLATLLITTRPSAPPS